uniref:Uncharacterized protein n=1 Tax=Arundo donax TaxID=35708 RepID=A0A0A9DT61_ARUDO
MLCGLATIRMGRFPQTAENLLNVYFTLFSWELKIVLKIPDHVPKG